MLILSERILLSFAKLGKDSDILTQEIIQKDTNVEAYTKLVDKEIRNNSNAHIGIMSESMDQMKTILNDLQRPLATMETALEEIQDGLKSKYSHVIMK